MNDNTISSNNPRTLMLGALDTANASYITRKGEHARVNKGGFQPDIATARDIVRNLSDEQGVAMLALCEGAHVDLLAGLRDVSNVKVSKRTVAFLALVTSPAPDAKTLEQYVQGSVRTALHEVSAILNGASNRESLCFAATGTMREGANENTLRDISIAGKLRRIVGKTKISSEQTQNSVAFSKGGLCSILGIAKKESRKGFPTLNRESPVLRAMLDTIGKVSEGQITLYAQEQERKGKRK